MSTKNPLYKVVFLTSITVLTSAEKGEVKCLFIFINISKSISLYP